MDNKKKKTVYLLLLSISVLLLILLALLPGKTGEKKAVIREKEAITEKKDPVYSPEIDSVVGLHKSKKEAQDAEPEKKAGITGELYIIIDDVGYNMHQIDPFLDLSFPITFSVLPSLPHTRETAKKIIDSNQEIMLHLPMEPINGEDPGPGAIYAEMDDEEVLSLLRQHLNQLPEIQAVNNHMGSLITGKTDIMSVVLKELSQRGLVFIDSLTTPDSVVKDMSSKYGMKYFPRTVFLDNSGDPEKIKNAFTEGKLRAKENGKAVLIGHIWSNTLPSVLREM